MAQRLTTYLAGVLSALAISALLLILLTPRKRVPIELVPPPTPGPIRVHIAGAVVRAGVYELEWPAIVQDAVDAAGGAAEDADLNRINLAAPLAEGERVFVPIQSNTDEPVMDDPLGADVDPALQIDINHASLAQLETLPGIGPSLAQKIVEYREEHGYFTRVEDLMHVSGIGPAKLDQFRNYVRVE